MIPAYLADFAIDSSAVGSCFSLMGRVKQLCSVTNQLYGTVNAEFLGIKGEMIILGLSPFEVGIKIIVVGSLLILFGNELRYSL